MLGCGLVSKSHRTYPILAFCCHERIRQYQQTPHYLDITRKRAQDQSYGNVFFNDTQGKKFQHLTSRIKYVAFFFKN